MNIYDFCEKYNISHRKARKLHKDGLLRLDDDTPEAVDEMRRSFANGDELSAAMLVELVENPGMILDLGRYVDRAQKAIDALGKIEPAPKAVAACVTDAAKGDPESVDTLLQWLGEIIPPRPVGHSFIAVRLLLGLAPNIRKYDIPRIPRALLECRRRSEFADWWSTEKRGARNVTIYRRPKNSFDL